MSGERRVADLLVDSDVFIDHLRGAVELRPRQHRLHYSVITSAELLSGQDGTDLASAVLAPFREIPVNRAIAERAGRIRREFGLHLGDALIAGTAVEHGLALVTGNRRDFEGVHGLRLRSLR
jgi:predicted nucleic acid-binding protein